MRERVGRMSSFPENRMRRMRATPTLRRLVQETRLSVSDLIYPVFVTEETNGPRVIEPMPGIFQHSLDSLTVRNRGRRGFRESPQCWCSAFPRTRTK